MLARVEPTPRRRDYYPVKFYANAISDFSQSICQDRSIGPVNLFRMLKSGGGWLFICVMFYLACRHGND